VTRDRKLAILKAWQERMQACEAATDDLIRLTMAAPESPLINSVYSVMGLATRQASDLVGCTDEWLSAWWLEHKFGERPMQAGLTGEPLRDISTLDELVALICDDEAKEVGK
jgi:hypothetical protein